MQLVFLIIIAFFLLIAILGMLAFYIENKRERKDKIEIK